MLCKCKVCHFVLMGRNWRRENFLACAPDHGKTLIILVPYCSLCSYHIVLYSKLLFCYCLLDMAAVESVIDGNLDTAEDKYYIIIIQTCHTRGGPDCSFISLLGVCSFFLEGIVHSWCTTTKSVFYV